MSRKPVQRGSSARETTPSTASGPTGKGPSGGGFVAFTQSSKFTAVVGSEPVLRLKTTPPQQGTPTSGSSDEAYSGASAPQGKARLPSPDDANASSDSVGRRLPRCAQIASAV